MNWKNKKVLVTGSEGMIGKELVLLLNKKGAIVYKNDLKLGTSCSTYEAAWLSCNNMDFVFHLAGVKGNPKMTKERPVDFMYPMLSMDVQMIMAAQRCNVKRFLYTSSIAVENLDSDKYPAWAKKTAETLIKAMRIQYPNGTRYCIVRPSNVYGKEDLTIDNLMVVSSLIKQVLRNKKLVLDKKGSKQIRDVIYSRDVAKGMIRALEEMPEYPVNLCSGIGISIKKIAEEISKNLNVNIEYKNLNLVLGKHKRVMKRNWNNPLTVSLEEGIKEVIDYVRSNKL